jgi:hypothetical protein
VSKSRKILFIGLILVLGLYYYWPQISRVNILSPKEQEVHGYLKEMIPAVRKTLQKFKQLEEEPVNAAFAAELGDLSDDILTINVKYWEIGSRSQTFVRMLINKVRGSKDQKTSFLAHWRGPEKDPESLDNMRMDTRTLFYRAWVIKESGDKLAKGLQNMLVGWDPAGKNSTREATALVETSWRSLGDVDQVYRRWKGNFRPPFSFSS